MRIIQHDSVALSQLYDEAAGLVFSVALRILENRADAEEVVVDVFSQVWNCSKDWDSSRGSVTAWLILLSRSRALDRARWRKSRTAAESHDPNWTAVASPEQSAEYRVAVLEQQQKVRRAMECLAENQRSALEMAFFEGLTHQEIADRLGEPLGTVKSRIRVAMLKMKSFLEGTLS